MYLEYYSLERPPFRITPDPSLFFTGGANGRGVVLEALLYAVTSGEGILKVVGEVGSGKTMLCRMLEQRLPASVEVVYLANPNLSPHDILYAIAFELKLPVDHNTQRLVLMQHLQDYLLKQHSANRTVLVVIEEAQSMPIETLEEIRLFSNLETHQHKLMQIVLFGQPELDKNLQSKSIRQLRERITHSFYLLPLTVEETGAYIRFRLQAAGCPCPQVFSDAAERLIAKASGGLTRRINILADKAMLAAYAESATIARPRAIDNLLKPAVLPKHVRAAIKDSDYDSLLFPIPRGPMVLVVLVMLLVLVAVWWQLRTIDFSPAEVVSVADVLPVVEAVPLVSANAVGNAEEPQAEIPAVELEPVEVVQVETPALFVVDTTAEFVSPAVTQPVTPDVSIAADIEEPEVGAQVVTTPEVVEPQPAEPTLDEPGIAEPDFAAVQEPVTAGRPIAFDTETEWPRLLNDRRTATVLWLSSVNPQAYIVQMVSVASAEMEYVTQVLNQLRQSGHIANTYACLSDNRGRPFWKVVYGSFATVDDARQFITSLPLGILSNRPFVQNVSRLGCDELLGVSQQALGYRR